MEYCSTLRLPGQTELALTVLLERIFLLQMGLPIRTELALMGLLGGTLLHIAFTWTNRTRTYNFNNEYTKTDGITNRYNRRQRGQIF